MGDPLSVGKPADNENAAQDLTHATLSRAKVARRRRGGSQRPRAKFQSNMDAMPPPDAISDARAPATTASVDAAAVAVEAARKSARVDKLVRGLFEAEVTAAVGTILRTRAARDPSKAPMPDRKSAGRRDC